MSLGAAWLYYFMIRRAATRAVSLIGVVATMQHPRGGKIMNLRLLFPAPDECAQAADDLRRRPGIGVPFVRRAGIGLRDRRCRHHAGHDRPACEAFALFGEKLAPLALVGMAVCVVGVFLAAHSEPNQRRMLRQFYDIQPPQH